MPIVTVANCQNYCRLSAGTDDTLFGILLAAAEDWIERTFGLGLSEAEHIEHLDGGMTALWPFIGPIISVSEVYDEEEEDAEDTSHYYLRGHWSIRRNGGSRWAEGDGRLGRGRYQVTYTGGYGGSGASSIAVPAVLQECVLQLVARAYDNRAGITQEGSAGHNISFASLADTDVVKKLQSLKPTALIG